VLLIRSMSKMPTADGASPWLRTSFLRSCAPKTKPREQHGGPLTADGTSSTSQAHCSGTFSTVQRQRTGTSFTGQRQSQQQLQQQQESEEEVQPLSFTAPPPRYDAEVFELLGDNAHAISERWSEMQRQKQKVDVRAYMQDHLNKAGLHTTEADSAGLDEAMQGRSFTPVTEALQKLKRTLSKGAHSLAAAQTRQR